MLSTIREFYRNIQSSTCPAIKYRKKRKNIFILFQILRVCVSVFCFTRNLASIFIIWCLNIVCFVSSSSSSVFHYCINRPSCELLFHLFSFSKEGTEKSVYKNWKTSAKKCYSRKGCSAIESKIGQIVNRLTMSVYLHS